MTVLILGPNGSGKSAYAEELVVRLSTDAIYYIATMIPSGEENQTRIEKHRDRRKDMGFVTIEKQTDVSEIAVPPSAAVLLEDVSNLLANAMFNGKRDGNTESVFGDITALCEKCRAAVLVTIEGLAEQPEYNDETCVYIGALNRLNEKLADFADIVFAMRGGTPVTVKGDANALG